MRFSSMKTHESLNNRVMVITGASSGIGRAAARAFAERGANLVLAARRVRALNLVAAECEKLGVKTSVVPTDGTDSSAMENLARVAMDTFGAIDVWINNAGVGLFGAFVELT